MYYYFHECELDDQLYQLRRDGKPVEIEPKVFDVLLYLLRNREHVVTKDELLGQLWPDHVVSETALTRWMQDGSVVGDEGYLSQTRAKDLAARATHRALHALPIHLLCYVLAYPLYKSLIA